MIREEVDKLWFHAMRESVRYDDYTRYNFAALIIEAEREACAKLCDAKIDAEYATSKVDHNEIGWTEACAAAIRARGEK